jgi:hypothetical protein
MFAVDGEQFNQFVEAGPMRIAFVFDAYRYVSFSAGKGTDYAASYSIIGTVTHSLHYQQ